MSDCLVHGPCCSPCAVCQVRGSVPEQHTQQTCRATRCSPLGGPGATPAPPAVLRAPRRRPTSSRFARSRAPFKGVTTAQKPSLSCLSCQAHRVAFQARNGGGRGFGGRAALVSMECVRSQRSQSVLSGASATHPVCNGGVCGAWLHLHVGEVQARERGQKNLQRTRCAGMPQQAQQHSATSVRRQSSRNVSHGGVVPESERGIAPGTAKRVSSREAPTLMFRGGPQAVARESVSMENAPRAWQNDDTGATTKTNDEGEAHKVVRAQLGCARIGKWRPSNTHTLLP